ncbi:hypothetical protein, partial [Burkholderia ubonensis]|uniref:hypothetical protein n=1 Tax=Burkholderia ubonensis TaxID=101571 RepID=UPI001E5D7DD9
HFMQGSGVCDSPKLTNFKHVYQQHLAILVQCLLSKHAFRKSVGAAHKAKLLASPLIHLQGDVFQRFDYRTSLQGDKRHQGTKKSDSHEALG